LPVYSLGDAEERTSDGVLCPNTQMTTFVVGKLYIHTISSSVIALQKQQISTRYVQRLWPLFTKTIKWPPRYLTPDDAEWISMAIFKGAIERTGGHFS
jgi:hypothetical protein